MKIILFVSIVILFYAQSINAQSKDDLHFEGMGTNYILHLYHDGTYSLSFNSAIAEDILESDAITIGRWRNFEAQILLQDTLFPVGNINRKIYKLDRINYHTLLVESMPLYCKGDTLKLTAIRNNEEGWIFNGCFKNSKINGTKTYFKKGYIEKYIDGVAVNKTPIKYEE